MREIGFESVFENYKGRIHDVDRKVVIENGELKGLKGLVTNFFKNQGVCALERVALVMGSSTGFIASFFALVEIGAVPLLLSKHTTVYELERFNEKYGISWIVSDCMRWEDLDKVFPNNAGVDFVTENYKWGIKRINEKAELSNNLKGTVLQPTSGSTGEVKLCVRDEYGCLAEPLNHLETSGMQSAGNVFCPLPLNHAYGFGTAFLLSIISSSNLILLNELDPRKVINILKEYQVSMFTGVPSVLDLLTKIKISTHIYIPGNILSAGAILDKELSIKFYSRFKSYIHPSYGSTETGEICYEREDIISETGSVGKPLNQTKIRIDNNEDGLGQVSVCNPSRMLGYLKQDGAIDYSSFSEEFWLPTGDLGHIDCSNRLILKGRLNNIINVFGVKVNPIEVEGVIKNLPGIIDAHVYAGKHRSGSDLVFAMVQCKGTLEERQIINMCKERLATQKVPSKIFVVDKIPRNQSGKIISSQLPMRYGIQTL